MLGGIKGELTSGNVKVSGTSGGLQEAIEDIDEEEDSTDTTIKVNYPEIQRYIKLSYDSIADIYNIANKIKI